MIEEPDFAGAVPDPSMDPSHVALSRKGWEALFSYLRSTGYNTELGRHLYNDVSLTGLVDVHAEGFVAMQLGGTPAARLIRVTLEQVQDHVLAAGLLTPAELEDYRLLLESHEYRWLFPTLMSVWGRRPWA